MALMSFFGKKNGNDSTLMDKGPAEGHTPPTVPNDLLLSEEQREFLEQDMAILDAHDSDHEERIQKTAEREVQAQAEDSAVKLQKVKMGRCPICGEHLRQRLSISICDECGWNKFDTPKYGKAIVHLRGSEETIEGDQVYTLKNGDCLLVRGDIVYAKIPAASYSWIEYKWTEDELDQRRRLLNDQIKVTCGWCGEDADINKDGFHLVHIAFGSSQERYCFCSDECYEAFRKMYPSRVHRNCYETNCAECNQCLKRYGDEAESIRTLAKDRLSIKPNDH